MLALCHSRYCTPDLLQLRELPLPTPLPHEVLIEVHAAGLNIADSFAVRGTPFPVRLFTGLLRPRYGIPGNDLAGIVMRVGAAVQRFRPGDEVYGYGQGACAEAALAPESTLALKPRNLTWQEAASLPTAALAALHALRDAGRLQAGQHLLINGASGGIGCFAIQLARWIGANVTGVCGPANLDLLLSLGASRAIDYTREDFALSRDRYDLILDNIENRPLPACRRVLRPRGTLLLNSGTGAEGLAFYQRLLKPLLLNGFTEQRLARYLSTPNAADLEFLTQLLESGTLRPVISRRYPLHQTAAALAHLETGHAQGKVVVEVHAPTHLAATPTPTPDFAATLFLCSPPPSSATTNASSPTPSLNSPTPKSLPASAPWTSTPNSTPASSNNSSPSASWASKSRKPTAAKEAPSLTASSSSKN